MESCENQRPCRSEGVAGREHRILRAPSRTLLRKCLRVVCAFALAFSGTLGVEVALATAAPSSATALLGTASPSELATPDQGNPDGNLPVEKPAIADVGMYDANDPANQFSVNNILSYASQGIVGSARIQTRGGSLDFDTVIWWNDGSAENGGSRVTWRLSDPVGIADVSPTGVITARGTGDGVVTVTAVVSAADSATGAELACSVEVSIEGQTDTPYVKSIVVCDDSGAPIDPSYLFEDDTLATAVLNLQARVVVHEPASDEDTEYLVTSASGLAVQTQGRVSDLVWTTSDEDAGVVSESGVYRPLKTGVNTVRARSNAGFNASAIWDDALIVMPGGDKGDWHPQSTLTVRVVWETEPNTVVKEKEYSIADLEALGTQTLAYTAIGGARGFKTFLGRGPYLSSILDDAGVNTDGVKELAFETADNYQDQVSWDLLVDTDRYYFPNIEVNSYAEAVQVAPMIAIDSRKITDGVSSVTPQDYDSLDGNRRFLLLFGAKSDGTISTRYQVYNIFALRVVLAGGPPPEGGGEPGPDPKGGGSGGGGTPGGSGSNPGESGGSSLSENSTGEGGGDVGLSQEGGSGAASRSLGTWSVLQAINKYPSDVDDLLLDNPFAPFALPLTFGFAAAGGLEKYLAYRRQKRMPAFA